MRDRSPARSTSSGPRATKLSLRSSHHRIAPLRISHHGVRWQPQVKDADREEAAPRRKKK